MTTSASSVMLSSLAENVLRKSTASRGPMFIFQFAAIIGLRIVIDVKLRIVNLGFAESSYTRESFPLKKFKGRSTSCGDKVKVFWITKFLHRCHRVSSAHDSEC